MSLTQEILRAVCVIIIIIWEMIDSVTTSFVDTYKNMKPVKISCEDMQINASHQAKVRTLVSRTNYLLFPLFLKTSSIW